MNRYAHTFYVKCPSNGKRIAYHLTIEAQGMIMVEEILAACAAHKAGYHEAIADDLVARLGGQHVLKAHHHGVHITTERVRLGSTGAPTPLPAPG